MMEGGNLVVEQKVNSEMEMMVLECDVCGQGHSTEECPELGLSSTSFQHQMSR